MDMSRAFNARMLRPIKLYTVAVGSYDAENVWQDGSEIVISLQARVTVGNKFSQFEEGISMTVEDGGTRSRDYILVYIKEDVAADVDDKIGWNGKYFNILQISDESHFGFKSMLAEKSKTWEPR